MKTRILALVAVLMLVLPFSSVLAQGTIVDIAAGDEQFSTLVTAVTEAGLVETLSGEGPFTVFAPTNDAFAAIPEDMLNFILADSDLLTAILTYHVVPGAVLSTDLSSGLVATVQGNSVTVTVDDMGVSVDQASVVAADIEASNGVIHVIDSVLITLPSDPLATTGDIVTAGSSTVFPLSDRIADVYQEEGYSGSLTIDSIGSGAGFERFCEAGESDISNASRPIREGEVESCQAIDRNPIEIRVGTDALAVTVAAENAFIEAATIEELQSIFGSAATWADVNAEYPGEDIQRFIPGTDSGTFDYFVEEVFDEDEGPILGVDPQTSEDDNFLVSGITGSEFAIGFFGYAYFSENQDSLKALSIDGVEPSAANVDNGTYPLARPLFIYSTASIINEKPQVADFIAFYLSNVNEYVTEVGYFPAEAGALYGAKVAYIQALMEGAM